MKKVETETLLFPTYAFFHRESLHWRVRVHGCSYQIKENSKRRYITEKILTKLMGISREVWEDPLFQKRINPFFASGLAGRKVRLGIQGKDHVLVTESNGHFHSEIELESSEPDDFSQQSEINVQVEVVEEGHSLEGKILVVPATGTSVISDIDDTVKHTQVTERNELIRNTMLNPFKVVTGMDLLFHRMQTSASAFHYVSSSPWQLFKPMMEMFLDHHLPVDSLHLRNFHWKQFQSWEKMVGNPLDKIQTIRMIIDDFPERNFILFGDVGEKDPELYYEILSEYPQQVEKILIRKHGEVDGTVERVHKLYANVPDEKWTLFDEPDSVVI